MSTQPKLITAVALLALTCLYMLHEPLGGGAEYSLSEHDSVDETLDVLAATSISAPTDHAHLSSPPSPLRERTGPPLARVDVRGGPLGFPLNPFTRIIQAGHPRPLSYHNVSATAAALLQTAFIEVMYGHPTTAVHALQAATFYGCRAGASGSVGLDNATTPPRDIITSLATDEYTSTWPPHHLHADSFFISDDPRALPRPGLRPAKDAAPRATTMQGGAPAQSFHEASLVKARGGALHVAIRAHHAACEPVVRAHARNGAYAMPPIALKRAVPPARVSPAVPSYTRVYILPFDDGPPRPPARPWQRSASGTSSASSRPRGGSRLRTHVEPAAAPAVPQVSPHELAEVEAVIEACHAVRQVEYGMVGYSTDGSPLSPASRLKYVPGDTAVRRTRHSFDGKPAVRVNETLYDGIDVPRTVAVARLLSRSPGDAWPPLGNVTGTHWSPNIAAVTPRMTGAVACEWVMAALTGASSWRQRPDGFGLSCATHILRPAAALSPPAATSRVGVPGRGASDATVDTPVDATAVFNEAVNDKWLNSSHKPERVGGAPIAAAGTGAHGGLGWMCDPLLVGGGWATGRGLVSLDHGAVVTFRDDGGPGDAAAAGGGSLGAAAEAAHERGAPDKRAVGEATSLRGAFALLIEAVDSSGAATCTDGDTWSVDVISRSGTVRYSTHVHSLGRGLYLAPIRVADDGEYVVSVALHYDRYAWLHPPGPDHEKTSRDTCCQSSCHARMRPLIDYGSPLYSAPFTMHLPFSHLSFRQDTRYSSYAISAIVTVKGTDTFRAAGDPPVCDASHLTHRFPVGSRWVRLVPPYDCPKDVCVGRVVPASVCAHLSQSVEGCNATWAFVPGNCVLRMFEPEAAWDVVSDRYIGMYGDSTTSDIVLSTLLALYGSKLHPRYRIPRSADLFLNRPTSSSFATHPRTIRDPALVQQAVPVVTSACGPADPCSEAAVSAAPIRGAMRASMGAAWEACELTRELRLSTLQASAPPRTTVSPTVLAAANARAFAYMYLSANFSGSAAVNGSSPYGNLAGTTGGQQSASGAALADSRVSSAEAEWALFEPGRGLRLATGFSGHHVPDGHMIGADSIRHSGGLHSLSHATSSHAALLPSHSNLSVTAARPLRIDRPDMLLIGSALHDAAFRGYRAVSRWWPSMTAATHTMAAAMARAGDPVLTLYKLEERAVAAAGLDGMTCASGVVDSDVEALFGAAAGGHAVVPQSQQGGGVTPAARLQGPPSALMRAATFANVSTDALVALFRAPEHSSLRHLHFTHMFTRLAESQALFAMAVANASGHLEVGSAGAHAVATGAWAAAASLGLPLSNVLRGALEETRPRAGAARKGAFGDARPQTLSTIIYHVPPQLGVGGGPEGHPGLSGWPTNGRMCRSLNPHRVQRFGMQLEDVLRTMTAPETRACGMSCRAVRSANSDAGGGGDPVDAEAEPAWAPYVDARVWLPWGTQAGPSQRLLAATGGSVCREHTNEGRVVGGGAEMTAAEEWPSLWEWEEFDDHFPDRVRAPVPSARDRFRAVPDTVRRLPKLLVYDMDTMSSAWSGLYGTTDGSGIHGYSSPLYAAMQGQFFLNIIHAALGHTATPA